MKRPTLVPKDSRYVSTTMSSDRKLKERWINGFKLAFFASILFALVGLPFSITEHFLAGVTKGLRWQSSCAIWLGYIILGLLIYPILFDWCARVFRIQFVRKVVRLPGKPPGPAPAEPPPPA